MSDWYYLLALVPFGIVFIPDIRKRFKRSEQSPEWCSQGEMIHGKIHKLVDTGGGSSEIVSIGGAGSGTAMIAYFCSKHCPGGCDQKHGSWWKVWG